MTQEQIAAVLREIFGYKMVSARYNIIENNLAALAKILLDQFPARITQLYLNKIAEDERSAKDKLENDPRFCAIKEAILKASKSFQGEDIEGFNFYSRVLLNTSARELLGFEKWPKMVIVDAQGGFISGCFLQQFLFFSGIAEDTKVALDQSVLPTEQELCRLFWDDVVATLGNGSAGVQSSSLGSGLPITFGEIAGRLQKLMTNPLTVRCNLSPTIKSAGRHILGEFSEEALRCLTGLLKQRVSELCQSEQSYLAAGTTAEFEAAYKSQQDVSMRENFWVSILTDLYAYSVGATSDRQKLESAAVANQSEGSSRESAAAVTSQVFEQAWIDPSNYIDPQRAAQAGSIPKESFASIEPAIQSYIDFLNKTLRLLNVIKVMFDVESSRLAADPDAGVVALLADSESSRLFDSQVVAAMALVQSAVDAIDVAQKTPVPSVKSAPSMRR